MNRTLQSPPFTKALVFTLALASACSVNESGKIKCVDDASCPRDYPVCSAGLCVEGTSTTTNTVSVLGVPGKSSTDPVRGTANVQVSAKAASGVKSLTLAAVPPTGPAKSFSATGAPVGSVYSVAVDTTQLADGSVSLKATLVAGDDTSLDSATATMTVDNTAPSVTLGTATPANARAGTLVTLDATVSEAVDALTATVSIGSTQIGTMTEVRPPDGPGNSVHHLGFAVTATSDIGTYTISVQARDAAGNVGAAATTTFRVPPSAAITTFSAVNLTVDAGTGPQFNLAFGPASVPAASGTITNCGPGGTTLTVTPATASPVQCDPINASTTYVLRVTADLTVDQRSVTVGVNVASVSSLNFQGGGTSVTVDAGTAPTINFVFGPATATATLTNCGTNGATVSIPAGATSRACNAINRNTTYVLTATAGTTTSSQSISATVTPAAISSPLIFQGGGTTTTVDAGTAPTLAFAFGPATATATLTNCGTNGATVTLPPGTTSRTCSAINANTTYVLTVTLGGTTATQAVIATVTQATISSPLVFQGAGSAITVDAGTAPTLNFAFGPATATATLTNCGTNGATVTLPPGTTTRTCSAINTNTTYVLTVILGGTAATQAVTATVTTATISSPLVFQGGGTAITVDAGTAPTLNFAFAPVTATATLTSCGTGGATVTLTPGSTSRTCSAINANTTYVLTVTLGGTTATQAVTATATAANVSSALVLHSGGTSVSPGTAPQLDFGFGPSTATATLSNCGTNGATVTGITAATTTRICSAIDQPTAYVLTVTAGTTTASSSITILITIPPGSIAATGNLAATRFGATATLLPNGKVLVTGGRSTAGTANTATNTAELYNPVAQTWSNLGGATKTMSSRRYQHTATLLNDGTVLVVGGTNQADSPVDTADLYDPGTDQFTATGSMGTARAQHAAVLLSSGKVLVAGGAGLTDGEIFDAGAFTPVGTGALSTARARLTATLLPGGTVLLAGGATSTTADLFDPSGTGTFSAAPNAMNSARTAHTATRLPDGRVLLVGGGDLTLGTNTAEIFNATTQIFTATSNNLGTNRKDHTATLLPGNRVLIAGGVNSGGTAQSSTEIFDVGNGDGFFASGTAMSAARTQHIAAFLFNGKGLLAAGVTTATNTADLFTP